MKKAFQFAKQVTHDDSLFSKFSANEILSTESMMRIRGGDGLPIIPPPPKP